jgi:prepilin-type N-terminal cleavage/methylation domain-containing protein
MHGGFSLLELLIVLAIVVSVAGLAIPAMRGPLDKARLTSAAKEVQATLAKARALAIREGTAVQFRYEPGGRRYVIERRAETDYLLVTVLEESGMATATPSGLMSESGESTSAEQSSVDADASVADSTGPTILREGQLPISVTFAAADFSEPVAGANLLNGMDAAAASAASTTDTPLQTLAVAGVTNWSVPIEFTPAGRTTDHVVRLLGQREFYVDVTLRGLTSMVRYSRPQRLPSAATAGTTTTGTPQTDAPFISAGDQTGAAP